MKRATVAVTGLVLMVLAPAAWALGKGSSMLALELTSGTADFADKANGQTTGAPNFTASYISAYDHSEGGLQGQYWYMMSEDYALTFSAGVGSFYETNKPGQGASAGSPEKKFDVSSFNLRLGGDRVVKLGDRTVMYGGPGVEYWRGSATFEPSPFTGTGDYTNETTTRIGISARIGGIMMINGRFGLTAHVGGRYGWATVSEQGADAMWTPSSIESAAGAIFTFGGE